MNEEQTPVSIGLIIRAVSEPGAQNREVEKRAASTWAVNPELVPYVVLCFDSQTSGG